MRPTKENASPDQRWELWKRCTISPPFHRLKTGEKIARKLLDDAWTRYASVLERIKRGAAGLTPDPNTIVHSVAELLQPKKPVNIKLLVYVGAFDEKCLTAAQNDKITTAIPIEDKPGDREFRMVHQLTHAVHISMGSFSGGWIHHWHDGSDRRFLGRGVG